MMMNTAPAPTSRTARALQIMRAADMAPAAGPEAQALREARQALDELLRRQSRLDELLSQQDSPPGPAAAEVEAARCALEDARADAALGEPEADERVRQAAEHLAALETVRKAATLTREEIEQRRAGVERARWRLDGELRTARQAVTDAEVAWVVAELERADREYLAQAEVTARSHDRTRAAGAWLEARRHPASLTTAALPLALPTIGPVSADRYGPRQLIGKAGSRGIDEALEALTSQLAAIR